MTDTNEMAHCSGFDAVARADARLLILGTLPGVESLKQQQYYAHRQNSFWKIVGKLLEMAPDLPYAGQLQCLMENRIALWDVCAAAQREGSLDADIRSPVANGFQAFFRSHEDIALICFNGQSAEKLFRRLVRPQLSEPAASLPNLVLPSTSPAHAGMRFEQKLALWREALACIQQVTR